MAEINSKVIGLLQNMSKSYLSNVSASEKEIKSQTEMQIQKKVLDLIDNTQTSNLVN